MTELTRHWRDSLAGSRPRVVLADGDDPRTVQAAHRLASSTPVTPLLLARSGAPESAGGGVGAFGGIGAIEVVDPAVIGRAVGQDPRPAGALDAVRGDRGITAGTRERIGADPLYLAAAAVRTGLADACVGGSTRPTADVIRAGIHVLGLAPGATTVTGAFLMALHGGAVVAYADCAVVPEPTAEELADIAVATSRTYHQLTGRAPVVAMLSFSTKGSAQHPVVQRVRAATELARARDPELDIDGELQFDAALMESVGVRKAAGSRVAGHANVFVFPNLDAGNIAYKITERLASAAAIGPILQGLAAPMNDLSRGCSVDDIVTVALVSAVQASQASQAGHRPPHATRPSAATATNRPAEV
ncbi:MAG: phosphotransacetylase [Carbonactinosporaceae bacterium]